jgi:DMSO/TMAO reductase YedYZ molybdopterin-dependent catalytic subunit
MPGTLDTLFRYLDGLKARPQLAELRDRLARLPVSPADVADHIRFSDRSYQRNLVRAGEWYNVWVMCWKNGQRSPVHDHAASACALRVLRGTLTETRYALAPNGAVKAISSRDVEAGGICAAQDADLHQIANFQAGNADLVTLHIYTPPLVRMSTFSLTDTGRGEDVWLEERRFVTTAGPENSETPLASIRGWVTPNRLFFVRNHFEQPTVDLAGYRLRVEGLVERPLELSWEDLIALPERSLFATVECAGNGRSFLQTPVPGVQWGAGAIGHAEWTGVPLARVLERAGVRPGAVEVLCEGIDCGTEADHPAPMQFARSLPLRKALQPDTLLAYRMNGELLSPTHGFPLRLFVPGWYGVASVKWLRRIEVLDRPFQGYYQTTKYTMRQRTSNGAEPVVVGPMAVKSEILRPRAGDEIGPGGNRVSGVAWAGEEAVAAVEVSTDGGRSWGLARLIGPQAPYCWTLWEYPWEVAEPGEYALLARAISASGETQPAEHDLLCGGYLIRHSRPTIVRVGAGRAAPARLGDAELFLYDMNAYAEENARFPLDVEMTFTGGEGI